MGGVTENPNYIKDNAWARSLALGLAYLFLCNAAHADSDPFQIDTGHWMSFDHYKDATARGVIELPPPEPAAPQENQQPPSSDQTAAPAASAAVTAAPSRPIDLPVMPGVNKGFDMRVNSTEDARLAPVAPVVTGGGADIHLSDKNWQSPSSTQNAGKDAEDDGIDVPLNVRMTYLPNEKIAPIATAEHASAARLGHIALEKSIAGKNNRAKTPAETAACAAIDAYKKQQLNNIQSDRETLKALQEAIHSLGLEKQLDFMSGNNSALNAPAGQNTPAADAPTTVR